MEESFLLKKHGGYTIEEQCKLTAEERAWLIRRIDKEYKREKEHADKQAGRRSL